VIYLLNHQIIESLKIKYNYKNTRIDITSHKTTGLVERKLSSVVTECSHIPQSIAIPPSSSNPHLILPNNKYSTINKLHLLIIK